MIGNAIAQEDPDPPKPDGSRFQILDTPISILQADTTLPDAIYLRRENGEPIFIPKVPYAEFERYLRERSGVRQIDLPSALLESIDVTGAIREGYAELKIELSMVVTDPSSTLVRLPLSMKNMNWVNPPKSAGGKSSYVVPGSDGEGLIWCVEPDGSAKYSLSLEAVVKVEQSFSESSLRLELPESATQIKLDIPGSALNIQWLGAVGEVLQSKALNNRTNAIVRGRGGIGTFVWRDQMTSRDLGAVEVDSVTRLLRSIDGKEYRGATRLRIVSDNRVGPRELIIRLPENAHWNPSPINGVPANWNLHAGTPPEGNDTRERLRLRLSDRGRDSVEEIPIDWTMAIDDPSNGSFSVMGIEVEGVQRHEGHLSIVFPSSTRFSWVPNSEYLLVRQLPANDVSDAIEYDFRFSRQPIRLQAVISEDDSLMRWRPDYLVSFDTDAMRLQGVITFPNDPSQLMGMAIVSGGWQLDTAVWDKTGELIQTELSSGNTLRFPMKSLFPKDDSVSEVARDPNSTITIRISAFQKLPTGNDNQIGFQLPQISLVTNSKRRIERGNGTLVVDRGGWQVNPSQVRVVGMARSSESPSSLRTILSDLSNNDLQFFRFQNSGQNSKWAGRIRRTQRSLSASMRTAIKIQSNEWSCSRNWSLRSTGPALERLPIRIPFSWVDLDDATGIETVSDRVKVTLNGLPVDLNVLEKSQNGWVIVEPTQNHWPESFDLEISYREPMDLPTIHAGQEKPPLIRMMLPQLDPAANVIFYDHSSTIEAGPDLLCRLEQTNSHPLICTNQDRKLSFLLSETSEQVAFEVMPLASFNENNVEVQRVWLQSTTNTLQRRERCVMRLQTKQSSIRFQLPSGWSEESTQLFVNHQKQAFEPDLEPGFYRFGLMPEEDSKPPPFSFTNEKPVIHSKDNEQKSILLEFWNGSPAHEKWGMLMDSRVPTIANGSGSAPLVWHVILPIDMHLWTSSSTLLSDQRWVWKNFWWWRQANFSQEKIEQEMGASVQPSIATQTNQYVFTSIGSIGANTDSSIGQIRVIPRYVLWLPVALIVLVLTALWPRMGVLRHPWLLLVVVVFLGLLSMSAPDMTIILIQAAMASLIVVVFVKLMSWASKHRVHRRSIFVNRSLPVPSARPPQRRSIEESMGSQPKSEALENLASPSTHAMEGMPAPQSPEVL